MYDEETFRRQYRVSRRIFTRIFHAVTGADADDYFQQRRDTCGRMGISPVLKITAAFPILAHWIAFDAVDESLSMYQATEEVSLLQFWGAVVKLSGKEYLRTPHEQDMKRILKFSGKRRIDGLLGSI